MISSIFSNIIEVKSSPVILSGIEPPININVIDSTIIPCNVLIENKIQDNRSHVVHPVKNESTHLL